MDTRMWSGEETQTFGQIRTHNSEDPDVSLYVHLLFLNSALGRRRMGPRRFFRHAVWPCMIKINNCGDYDMGAVLARYIHVPDVAKHL
jgi:hypothetical protein